MSLGEESLKVAAELVKAAGDNPDTAHAGRNLAKAARTISETINVALLPLAAVNFGYTKAKVYFEQTFQADISAKTANIPAEKLVEPKASIAGPALQNLAFAHDEAALKEMYLNLIARAMQSDTAHSVHPAFVEIIKQLTSDEAIRLESFIGSRFTQPIVQIRKIVPNKGFAVIIPHLARLEHQGAPLSDFRFPAMVENWMRLGLVAVSYEKHLVGTDQYSWVTLRPEFAALEKAAQARGEQLDFAKGIISRTSLGEQFAGAVGISNN